MLITPEQLPIWVPGDLTVDSLPKAWDGLRIRGYHYKNLDVTIPPLGDHMIVVYKNGATTMNRRCSGPWRAGDVGPGAVSILTQAEQSHWFWYEPIEVLHLYITPSKLASIASDALEKDIQHVELRDVLCAKDPFLEQIAMVLDKEVKETSLGADLLIDAMTNQLCIHILREYAGDFKIRSIPSRGLSRTQINKITKYIDENISETISLDDLASIAEASIYYFIRQFKISFGAAPHAYLMKCRAEKAKELIGKGDMPLKVIAATCGFADQSHMTRYFKKTYKITPAVHRKFEGKRADKKQNQ